MTEDNRGKGRAKSGMPIRNNLEDGNGCPISRRWQDPFIHKDFCRRTAPVAKWIKEGVFAELQRKVEEEDMDSREIGPRSWGKEWTTS